MQHILEDHFLAMAFFFFFFPFILASFSYLPIIFSFKASSLCINSDHSPLSCFLLASVLSSMASCLSFLVCQLRRSTPEMSSYLLILFLSMNSLYLSSSCNCLFQMSLSWMQITSSKPILGFPSRSRRMMVLLASNMVLNNREHFLSRPVLVKLMQRTVSFSLRAQTSYYRFLQSYSVGFYSNIRLSSKSMNLMLSFYLRSLARYDSMDDPKRFPSNQSLYKAVFFYSFQHIYFPSTSVSALRGIDKALRLALDSMLFTSTFICAGLRSSPEMVSSKLVESVFRSLIM